MPSSSLPSPRVTVLQRGGEKNHDVLATACVAFLRVLLSARMANTLAVRLEVRATKLDDDTLGLCRIQRNGSAAQRAFVVVLRRDLPLAEQVACLAHEMIHVAQAATGRLQFRRWKTDGKVHARWEGVDLGPVDDLPYATRPWEVEARRGETDLLRSATHGARPSARMAS